MCIHDDSGKVFSRKMKAFPFTEGEGLEKVLEGLGYKANLDISNKKIKISGGDVHFACNLNKKDFVQIRPDNGRKKIKVNFHKNISKVILGSKKNKNNTKSKINLLFKLPQSFITNVNIFDNSLVMDLTYEELLSNIKGENINKYNLDLDENSNWNLIKNMTYRELIDAFISSAEFEKSIIDLKTKAEKKNKKISALYVENYINIALTYTDFYSSTPSQKPNSSHPQTNTTNTTFDITNIPTIDEFISLTSGQNHDSVQPNNNNLDALTDEENSEEINSLNNYFNFINTNTIEEERNSVRNLRNLMEQSEKKYA